MQLALLHAIGNPSKPLRHTVGTNVAVIVGVGGLPTWPELLSAIAACLESNDPDALEGALDALYKACQPHQSFKGLHIVLDCCAIRAGSFFSSRWHALHLSLVTTFGMPWSPLP